MNQQNVKVPVTARALLARINKALAKNGEKMCATRADTLAHAELGEFYIVNAEEAVTDQRCTLDSVGRKLGVLKAYEELVK